MFRAAADGRILAWNTAAERLTGIPATEAEGRPCWNVIRGCDGNGVTVCHPGCSAARLAGESWPVRPLEVCARTPLGPKWLTISTIVVETDGDPVILHPMHESSGGACGVSSMRRAKLTPRQREILAMLGQGVRAKEIASALTLSETTVRNHIQAVLAALGVHSQLEAVARARMLRLVDDESAA